MSRRAVIVISVAPTTRPPCFPTSAMWTEYLTSSADYQGYGSKRSGPLDLRNPEPAFNYRWDFCGPCAARYAMSMQKLGKCKPHFLRDLEPSREAAK